MPVTLNCGEPPRPSLLSLAQAPGPFPTPMAARSAPRKLPEKRRRAAGFPRGPTRRRQGASGGAGAGAAAARGRSAAGGRGGPGACARTSHSPPGDAHSRVGAVRPVRARRPPPGPSPACAQRVWARGGGDPGPLAAPHRVDAPPLPQPPPSEPLRGPEAARRRPSRRPGRPPPPEAPLLPRARGRRLLGAERGMSRRRPRALGARGRGSASPPAAEPRGLGLRVRARRGQRRPRSGGRRPG